MKTNKDNVAMKNGIERFEKVEGTRAAQRLVRYNWGTCRYELECAFGVLKRAAKAMPDANDDELRQLALESDAANAVLNAYFILGDAITAWLPTSTNEAINVPFEMNLLQAMNNFDETVADLKPYL